MAYDDNNFNTVLTTSVTDSFNNDEDNSENYDLSVSDSFNDTDTTTDSGNTDVALNDSFNSDFGNTSSDIDDSFNQATDTHTWTYTDESQYTNTTSAGDRSYDTGFGGLGGAAAGSVGGELLINNQNSIVDQSVNQNIAAEGPVWQSFESSSVSASGDNALAAGGDIDVDTYVDQSTSISAEGDVLIESEKTVTWTEDSGNTSNFSYTYTDESIDVDIDDSWNTNTLEVGVDNSFNDDTTSYDIDVTTVDYDAVVDSYNVDTGDIDFAL